MTQYDKALAAAYSAKADFREARHYTKGSCRRERKTAKREAARAFRRANKSFAREE